MKLFRNCCKCVYVLCFIALVCVVYSGIFQYLGEGGITLPKSVVTSVRYFQLADDAWKNIEGETVNKYTNVSDNEAIGDWGSPSEDDQLSSNENDDNSYSSVGELSTLPAVTNLKVMNIFDFNHRKCCPLNYSFSECEYSACKFTDNSAQADLVMINGARLKGLILPPRPLGQIWLMYTKEPPTFKRFKSLGRRDFYNQVNWTRCIFRDSTFRGHYGSLESRAPPPNKDYDEVFAQKRYQAALFVSHCNSPSRRDEYVKRMRSEIDVDIFGNCGNKTCGHHGLRLNLYGSKDPCLQQVSMDYKFYLSFENSMCSDYVTEKFYKLFENVDVIPVVRGGANYSERAPAGSYVNAEDFGSPEELGKYLYKLSKNKQEYLRMLKIKDRYTNAFPKPRYSCELCKALHTRRDMPSTYDNILTWMTDHCWLPSDL